MKLLIDNFATKLLSELRKILSLLFVFFALTFNTGFQSQEVKQEELPYKPTNNFDWLMEFAIISKTSTLELWTENPQFTFDSAGIVQVGATNKNPCTISEYALALYNKYIETNDEKYKKDFLIQVSWLINPANYELLDHEMLGHSYKYSFHDLQPPWYGGLAEAEFMSVLIRYYSLTKDVKVLPLIIKTRNFLLTAEEDGGLFSKTPEGNIWIEEYGKSKQERHVLNGFFVTVICLYEYCKLFPDDKEAADVLKMSFESIKKSLKFYERQNWVTYNRGDYRLVVNWYMKAQVIELSELFRISKDDFFKYQSMLWSSYAFEKPIGRKPGWCLIENYNFSVPGIEKSGKILPLLTYPDLLAGKVLNNFNVSEGLKKDNINSIKDNNLATTFTFSTDSIYKSPLFVEMDLEQVLKINKISLVSEQSNILSGKLKIFYAEVNTGIWKEIKMKEIKVYGSFIYFIFDNLNVAKLKLQLSSVSNDQKINLREIRVHNDDMKDAPLFSHVTTNIYQTSNNSIDFSCKASDTEDLIVFYKSAPDSASMANQIWTQEKSFKSEKATLNSTNDHFFRFLVIYKIKSSLSSLENLNVK